MRAVADTRLRSCSNASSTTRLGRACRSIRCRRRARLSRSCASIRRTARTCALTRAPIARDDLDDKRANVSDARSPRCQIEEARSDRGHVELHGDPASTQKLPMILPATARVLREHERMKRVHLARVHGRLDVDAPLLERALHPLMIVL